ncbi:uncharacterized protein M421DRAFT_349933 [Didymella exigua CBS 183.55]|uniref:Uncharacterized protein n=1 Tax=Didymella exigua CBS 183.55 TaxID=1150837 RepID=A0A6A5R7Q8_9PLEO|nr:uncharacterized protein M421DRAFT_349933 [Didymella exigua CBS 183.55]KAF1922746.1 hypothetical protein M421DRAFT_349933 [Didymella exigua CBS 183.55]
MLAPRASSAFVCLRCELQLTRYRTSSLARQSSKSDFSTSTRRHDAADERQAVAPGQEPADTDSPKESLRISREYLRQGKIVRHRKAKLGMTRMDEDADVLVMNEAPIPEELKTKEPEVSEPISVPDILSSLTRDSAPATQEDVVKQLEGLRPLRGNPNEPQYVTTADFVKLVAALTRGFTTTQLSDYYSTAKSIKKETVYKVVKATVKATKRSEWHPTTTDIKKRLPGVEAVKPGKKQKPKGIRKATLVDKILRDAWKLELLEEIEAPGELELKLKEWELKLLQNGANDSALARIARIRNAKAEIHWPTNVLRITADKTTAEYMADDVEAALSKARTTSLDLKLWVGQLNEVRVATYPNLAASLPAEYVSSLTGTTIFASNHHTLKIHGLDEASIAEAKRTLIRLLPFKESAPRTIDTQKLDAAKQGTYLSPVHHDASSVDFNLRGLSVGRWALPVTRAEENHQVASEPTSNSEQSLHSIVNRVASLLKPPADAAFTGPESKPRNRQTGYWAMEPEYKVSADFGQALFPLEMSDPNKVIEAASDSSRSPFHPAIPGLGSLLASSELQNISRTETPALLYDFVPAPDQKDPDVKVGPTFPRLFIQVRTGRDGNQPTIHKLSLGFQERVHDVLLPDQAADIRFHRYGRLRFSSKSHHDKNVEEWTEAVRQNIESGGRLSAPSLTIDIPKWTVPGFPSDETGMLPIKYLFSGIQFRQSVSGRLLDTQVSYSTVQSGKLGAKGGALSAYSEDLKGSQAETQIRDFATKCMQVVDYISQAGAQTQPLRQVVLPRNEYSARKQRRAELQAAGGETLSANETLQDAHATLGGARESDDLDEYEESEASFDEQAAGARLASRLDNDIADVERDTAIDEARDEADKQKRTVKSKVQEQEAKALLDDLFGDELDEESTAEEKDTKDTSDKESEKF